MQDGETEELEKELRAAEQALSEANSAWNLAKRDSYKAWEREYELTDERSQAQSRSFQQSAQARADRAERKQTEAKARVERVRKRIAEHRASGPDPA